MQDGSTRSSTTEGGTTPTGISMRSQNASGQRAIRFTWKRCLKTSTTSPASAPTSPKHRRNRYARAVERFPRREPTDRAVELACPLELALRRDDRGARRAHAMANEGPAGTGPSASANDLHRRL